MKLLRLSALFLAAITAFPLRAAELNIFAAASLSDALGEIAKAYAPKSGDKLFFNLSASSTLALQIKHGAPADLFFSADESKMDDLAKAGLLVPETRRSLLSNTLVVVVASDGKLTLTEPADLAKPSFGRIALAEPQTVPAGVYAKEWLQKRGLWKNVVDKVIPTENVRACLAAVASGNVDAGIVYKTDALISNKVKIAYEVGSTDGPRISYPLAVIKTSKQIEAAQRFAAYLAGAEARAIFTKYGFLPAP